MSENVIFTFLRCLTSLAIMKMQSKMTLRFHLASARITFIHQPTADAGENAREKESSYMVGGSVNCGNHYENQY
jgi:hypothetical protein